MHPVQRYQGRVDLRNAEFKACVERVAENFPGVTSRSEKVKLARDFMLKLFEGVGKFILLKARHLDTRSKLFEEYAALVNKT